MAAASSIAQKGLPSLLDITLDEISSGLDEGSFTSVDLVTAYIARTRDVNDELHAVIEINPDALKIARDLDMERLATGRRRGPLHGVPIYLKDNIVTFDKMSASAGSYALLGSRPARESKVVAKLREAGTIIQGKANLSEWANMRSSNETPGWSPRGGYTKGIYYPGMSAQGSSSGPAVTSGLGLAFASIGTETDGSLTQPAAASNVVVIKPTVGLVSRDGCIPLSQRQDSIGPIARTVRDAAQILGIIAGRDEHDKYTSRIPFDTIPDYTKSCTIVSLTGLRLGIPRNAFSDPDNVNPDTRVMKEFERAVQIFKNNGARIVDEANFSGVEEYKKFDEWSDMAVLCTDFKHSMADYLDSLVDNPYDLHTVQDLIDWTQKHAEEESYPEYDTGVFEQCQSGDSSSREYQEVLKKELFIGGEGGIPGAIEREQLDAIIAPAPYSDIVTHFAAIQGLPMITVPLGYYSEGTDITWDKTDRLIDIAPGIPFGLIITGKAFSEQTLIRIAYAFEQLAFVRGQRRPFITPAHDLDDIVQAKHIGDGNNEATAQSPVQHGFL